MANSKVKEITFLDGKAIVTGNVGAPNRLTVDRKTTQTTIWVSPEGLDTNDGTFLSPYLTIAKAFTMVSATRNKVLAIPGVYTITEPLVFPTMNCELIGLGGAATGISVGVTILPSPKSSSFPGIPVEMRAAAASYGTTTLRMVNVFIDGGYDDAVNYSLKVSNTLNGGQLDAIFEGCYLNGKFNKYGLAVINDHTDANWLKLWWRNGGVEGLTTIETQNASDRFLFYDMTHRDALRCTGAYASMVAFIRSLVCVGGSYGTAINADAAMNAYLVGCVGWPGSNVLVAVTAANITGGIGGGVSVNPT